MLEHDDDNRSSQPLRGVVLCCTAILPVQRSELASMAAEMGATHKLDLTSDVTHLIVGDTDTPKYKYVAKERPDVKVLRAEWVQAVRESWLEGGDTDVEAIEREYHLPTFAGLRICLTGFEDLQHREGLAAIVQKHGAEYSGDLTKQITHLIAAAPKGKKYEYAKQWKIRIVSIEWLDDSIERGMILDETLYDPLMKHEDRGKDAWVRSLPTPTSLGKRSRQAKDMMDSGRRKLRRTASSKLTSQNEDIWADITAGAFAARVNQDTQWEDCEHQLNAEAGPPQVKPESEAPAPQLLSGSKQVSNLELEETDQIDLPLELHYSIFKGTNVYLYGFTKKQTNILADHLSSNGAVVNELNPSVMQQIPYGATKSEGYVVMPHTTAIADRPSVLDENSGLLAVSEWWVERCLYWKVLVDPEDDILSRPFDHLPVEGFEDMVISSTNFDGVELLHLSKALVLLGATYDDHLKPHASALICNSVLSRKEKTQYAFNQSIPAVSMKWLLDCVERGQRMAFEDYLIQPIKSRESRDGPISRKPMDTVVKDGPVENRPRYQVRPGRGARPHKGTRVLPLETSRPESDVQILDESLSTRGDQDVGESHDPDNDSNSQALRELQPEVNSPKRPSQSSMPVTAREQDDEDAEFSALAPPWSMEQSDNNLHDQIKALRANMITGRPVSAPEPSRGRRRRGLLGRAPSGLSNQSAPGSFSRASSVETDGPGDGRDPTTAYGRIDEIMPSQVLMWEDEEVARQKAEVLRRVGGKVDDISSSRVASIGLVKDSVMGEAGVGSRVRRRPRQGGRGDG